MCCLAYVTVLILCRSQHKSGISYNVCCLAYDIVLILSSCNTSLVSVSMCVSWVTILRWCILSFSVHPTQSCNVCFLYHGCVDQLLVLCTLYTTPGQAPVVMCVSWVTILCWFSFELQYKLATNFDVCFLGYILCWPITLPSLCPTL